MQNENPLCTCGWLEREADEPSAPIRFDPRLNEYNIVCEGEGSLRIYYCPFCGGRAPESKRDLLFAHIDHEEKDRLVELTYRLRSLQEVISALGEPDEDTYASSTTPEKNGVPLTVDVHRRLVYHQLSPIADVCVLVFADNRVRIMLQGKYIGLPDDRQQ